MEHVAVAVLNGLVRKRGEIAGRLEHAQTTVRQLVIDLDMLDATIRLFAPDIDLDEIRPKPLPPRHSAFKGEVSRIVMDILRDAGKPLSTPDLTLHVMEDRSLNTGDKRLVTLIQKRVGACLRNLRIRRVVQSTETRGKAVLWEIASSFRNTGS